MRRIHGKLLQLLPTNRHRHPGSQDRLRRDPAPTPTTQSSSWLCHATYTNPSSHGAGAWITVSLSGCGTLPAGTAYWIATDSNDTHAGFPYGFWNCGGSCNGSAPTVGTGTYGYRYISATYGQYTGMGTSMLAGGNEQASQFVSLRRFHDAVILSTGFSPDRHTWDYLGRPQCCQVADTRQKIWSVICQIDRYSHPKCQDRLRPGPGAHSDDKVLKLALPRHLHQSRPIMA